MMKVEYSINTGTPCEIPVIEEANSKKEALQSFRDYIADCERFGTDYSNAFIEIHSDKNGTEIYSAGPRGGIIKVY